MSACMTTRIERGQDLQELFLRLNISIDLMRSTEDVYQKSRILDDVSVTIEKIEQLMDASRERRKSIG